MHHAYRNTLLALSPIGPDLSCQTYFLSKCRICIFWVLYDFESIQPYFSEAIQPSRLNRVSPCLSRSAMQNFQAPLNHLMTVIACIPFITLDSRHSSRNRLPFRMPEFDGPNTSGFHDILRLIHLCSSSKRRPSLDTSAREISAPN